MSVGWYTFILQVVQKSGELGGSLEGCQVFQREVVYRCAKKQWLQVFFSVEGISFVLYGVDLKEVVFKVVVVVEDR